MLGEKIGEMRGQVTAMRVIAGPNGPLTEVTIKQAGKLLGIEVTDLATYTAETLPNGSLKGGGVGMFRSESGDTGTIEPNGVGRLVGKAGALEYRGCVYFQTPSQKFARLNGLCVLFEHDCDEQGATVTRLYEWK